MTTHLGLQRILLPSAQVSQLTTGSITLPSARGAFVTPTAYESIATILVGAGGASGVTFTSIPATYKHLQIRMIMQSNRNTYPIDEWGIWFNSDNGSNYSYHKFEGDGTTAYSSGAGTQSLLSMDMAGTVTGATWGSNILDVFDYANTNKNTTIKNIGGTMANAAVAGYFGVVAINGGTWYNTAAVTSIYIFPQNGSLWNEYSGFALYGIKAS